MVSVTECVHCKKGQKIRAFVFCHVFWMSGETVKCYVKYFERCCTSHAWITLRIIRMCGIFNPTVSFKRPFQPYKFLGQFFFRFSPFLWARWSHLGESENSSYIVSATQNKAKTTLLRMVGTTLSIEHDSSPTGENNSGHDLA
jgi:hypothetical protein